MRSQSNEYPCFAENAMTVLLELDDNLEDRLHDYCRQHELPESELLNRLLRDFLGREEQREIPSSFELWQQVCSPVGSGRTDLGSHAKFHLREKLRGKHFG
jgi:hypothetical protein